MECEEAIYSNSVLDFIVRTPARRADTPFAEVVSQNYGTNCFQMINSNFTVIYDEDTPINMEGYLKYEYLGLPACYGLMDQAAAEATQVIRVRQQPYLNLYGQGLLIGFVDTGIDWNHPAFIRADGRSRIIDIWDQTVREGESPEGFLYGTEFTNEQINAALLSGDASAVPSVDENGHGTFLAGVAAGKIVEEENFTGIAPDSEILVVKCKEAKGIYRDFYRIPTDVVCYQENDIMLGVSYLLKRAREMHRPIVICLGIGTNLGNHSGASRLGSYLNQSGASSGVNIVAPAGNEGNTRHHFLGTPSASGEFEEIDINTEGNSRGFTAEIWYKTPGSFDFQVISPSGDATTIVRTRPPDFYQKEFLIEDTRLDVYVGSIISQSSDQVILLRFEDSKAGIWKIRISAGSDITRTFNAWLPISDFLETETYFLRSNPDFTICEPANATDLITVSAYNTQTNALYLSASRGYNLLGDVKPMITAPGVDVFGPLPRGRYGTKSGTSVASAVTAGVCALLYQQFSQYELGSIAIGDILVRGAQRKTNLVYPNNEWGYGTVDLYGSILIFTNTTP